MGSWLLLRAASRRRRISGQRSASSVATRNTTRIGRPSIANQSPPLRISALRRFDSIIGPRIRPSTSAPSGCWPCGTESRARRLRTWPTGQRRNCSRHMRLRFRTARYLPRAMVRESAESLLAASRKDADSHDEQRGRRPLGTRSRTRTTAYWRRAAALAGSRGSAGPPIRTADTASPGMPSVSIVVIAPPIAALHAAQLAARPRREPLPKSALSGDVRRACSQAITEPISPPAPESLRPSCRRSPR